MTTLRETIQADIASLETDLSAKKQKLAEIETGFVGILDRDVEEVKTLWRSLAAHLFPHATAAVSASPPTAAPAAPAP